VGRAIRRARPGTDAERAADPADEDDAPRPFRREADEGWAFDDGLDDPYGDDEDAWWERA
jgi:hypothetical protein